MTHHRLRLWPLILNLILLLALSACNDAPLGPEQFDAPDDTIESRREVEVLREGVFSLSDDNRQTLPAAEQVAILEPEQGLAVDAEGRALLRLGNRLSLELLQGAELLQIQQTTTAAETTATVAQNGGTLLADLTLAPEETTVNLTVQTAFAAVNGQNSRFAVVREPTMPLEWVVNLNQTEEGAVSIILEGENYPLAAGQARWITSGSAPGPALTTNANLTTWLEGVRSGAEQPPLADLLLAPANILADTGLLSAAPQPNRPLEFGRDIQGPVWMTVDEQGLFGNPGYQLEDCNEDGVQDLAVTNGIIYFDFRELLARVEAVDVSLLNRDRAGRGLLQAADPSGTVISRRQVSANAGELETLSLRSDIPFHSAELRLSDACFFGLSLTPPGGSGQPAAPRPVTENLQSDLVVNVLESSAERQPQNGQLQAVRVAPGRLTIDGRPDDWETLITVGRVDYTPINAITHNDGCANRYPGAEALDDLAARAMVAYDEQAFYAIFIVLDDGLVPYAGADERYFLGDSPQLLLDLDLAGDFDEAQLSGDDVQIDLLADTTTPGAALWQLNTLTASRLASAQVAVNPIDGGYVVEAALPWNSLGAAPQPGDRLGIVASVSDNDTPNSSAQECIISTSPQRDWRNPTTWGTVLLLPTPLE